MRGLIVLMTVSVGGCSSLFPSKARDDVAASAPVLRLELSAPDPLRSLLAENLDLGRVNRLARGEPLQDGELDRLVAAAPQQARALLDTEGYFNADIDVTVAPAPASGALPTVRVVVTAGPRTLVGSVDIAIQGPLASAVAAGQPHARQADQAVRADWPLPPGAPFRDADWTRAKAASIAGLRAQGWLQADWAATQARVDAASQRAALAVTASSGPLFLIGPLRVRGLKVQDVQTVENIADLKPGAPATEATLLDIQERLQKSDLFGTATVSLDTTPPRPDATPVAVRLGERRLQEATFGVGISANVGPRLTVDFVHRRPFDRPWLLRGAVAAADKEQRVQGELSTQTLPGLYRNLLGAGFSRVESDTDVVVSSQLRAGRAQDTQRIDRLLFLQWDRSRTTSALGNQRADALAVHYQGVWRRLDDLLLPTRGRAWTGQFAVGQASADPGGQGPFGRISARLNAYRPLGRNWYGQGRIELGQIYARSAVTVPDALRFRAGGDESVRGYAYRSLTPRVNGVEVGGNRLFTASLEAAHPLLKSIPQLWGAVFIDAGRAADSWRDLQPALGYGAGLRYRSPVGPVKLDLAWGEEERRLRLHLTVGLAF